MPALITDVTQHTGDMGTAFQLEKIASVNWRETRQVEGSDRTVQLGRERENREEVKQVGWASLYGVLKIVVKSFRLHPKTNVQLSRDFFFFFNVNHF